MSAYRPTSIIFFALVLLLGAFTAAFPLAAQTPTPVSPTTGTPIAHQSGVLQVAAGASHTCILTTMGAVKCWGNNEAGQLGDGTTTTRLAPVDVVGLTNSVSAIASGQMHTCALTALGGIKCWGYNMYGQSGNETATEQPPYGMLTAVDVSGLASGVSAIAAGDNHTCVLTTLGGVKCWGNNRYGQLGDGTTTSANKPVEVKGLASGVSAIAAGGASACALTAAGGVKCWGDNQRGQLGNGTTAAARAPMDVTGLTSGVTAIDMGDMHTCALMNGGGIKCWGRNDNGQLGDATTTDRMTPTDVKTVTGTFAISASGTHTCAFTAGGNASCWGNNSRGQLGDGTQDQHSTPAGVTGLTSGVKAMDTGDLHTCAVLSDGRLKCWGDNSLGQLGDGTMAREVTPVYVTGLAGGVTAIDVAGYHTCALTADGGVKCWGRNGSGQLGNGSPSASSYAPVQVQGLTSGVSAIAVGGAHTCALTGAGEVKCWGWNDYGQIGDDTTTSRPVPVAVSKLVGGVTAIAAGWYHTCALMAEGEVKCWGWNYYAVPVDVLKPTSRIIAIAAGGFHTCVLTAEGGIKCWGDNQSGQLGNGTSTTSMSPSGLGDVAGLTGGVSAIAAGVAHTCALTAGGGVKCWGDNKAGQLGDGTTTARLIPVDVAGLTSGVSAIAAGYDHTCALMTGGGIKCWGSNDSGELGEGSTTAHATPIDVRGLAGEAMAVAAGNSHTCALMRDGKVRCWGDNLVGQLGISQPFRAIPADVLGSSGTPGGRPPLLAQSGPTATLGRAASDRTQADGHSEQPALSADGRYVAFASGATNLVSGDTNGKADVFVHDRQTGKTTRVSIASDGTQGNGHSE